MGYIQLPWRATDGSGISLDDVLGTICGYQDLNQGQRYAWQAPLLLYYLWSLILN